MARGPYRWRGCGRTLADVTMGDELLLLAIVPGRRRTRVRSPERLRFALRAAELAELALMGRIALGERRIEVLDRGRIGTPRLDSVLVGLAGATPPPTSREWLRATPRLLTGTYVSRLQDQKVIKARRQRDRVGVTRYDILSVDAARRAALVERVTAAVRGSRADPAAYSYDLTLAVLARAAGLASAVHPGLRGLAARRRMTTLTASGAEVEEAALTYERDIATAVGSGVTDLTRGLYNELSEIYSDTTTGGHGLGHDLSSGGWSDASPGGGHHGGGGHGGGHGGW